MKASLKDGSAERFIRSPAPPLPSILELLEEAYRVANDAAGVVLDEILDVAVAAGHLEMDRVERRPGQRRQRGCKVREGGVGLQHPAGDGRRWRSGAERHLGFIHGAQGGSGRCRLPSISVLLSLADEIAVHLAYQDRLSLQGRGWREGGL